MTKESKTNLTFLIVGAIIALISSLISAQVIQKWEHAEQELKIANYIRTSVEYELKISSTLVTTIKSDLADKKNKQMSTTMFRWLHSEDLSTTIGSDIGYLNSKVIENYNKYISALKQCQEFRNDLTNRLDNTGNNIDKSKQQLNNYFVIIENLEKNGEELLQSLNQYYPKGAGSGL